MRCIPLMALTSLLLTMPAVASEPFTPVATASYNPWLAAGLTYVPAVPAAVGAAISTNPANPLSWRDSGTFAAVNPMPGLGHVYVGEPLRGLGFTATSLGLLGSTILANIALYQGRRSPDMNTSPLPWQEQVRNGVNMTYIVTATALSAWAAWDVYRIAEEKNR